MIDFKKVRFITSAPSISAKPKDNLPSVLFTGKSNVGKSTLINMLVNQKIAFPSKKAGKTRLLNYFLIDDSFYLVDAPGYGKSIYPNVKTINFAEMMESYLKEPSLKAVVLLLDLRHDITEEEKNYLKYLKKSGFPLIPVITKSDQMNQKQRHEAEIRASKTGLKDPIFASQKGEGKDAIKGRIINAITR